MRNTLIYFSVFLFTVLLFAEPAFADSNGQLTINDKIIVDSQVAGTTNSNTSKLFTGDIYTNSPSTSSGKNISDQIKFTQQTTQNDFQISVNKLFATGYQVQSLTGDTQEENSSENILFYLVFGIFTLFLTMFSVFLGYSFKRGKSK